MAPSTTTVTLSYNPSGQRASYHLVEPGQPTLDQQFTYRGGLLGQARLSSGATVYTDTYLYTDAGAPYELLRTTASGATSRYWYEVDGRGNVVALTDINGKVVDRYAYDSWGELTSDDSVNETVPQQLRYAGYWYDEKLSWYWLSVRYYDPEIERFLAPDPSEQDGVRTYVYAGDDPIDLTDPSGLDDGIGAPGSDLIGFFALGVGAVIAVAAAPEVLVGGAIVVGSVIVVGGVVYTVRQVATGNPASIPVPCTSGSPPPGTIMPTPPLGGTTVPLASSCTAATAIPLLIRHMARGSKSGGGYEGGQVTKLTPGDIGVLKRAGYDPHELKPEPQSRYDLFKDDQGNIYVRPKNGTGPGEDLGLNIKTLRQREGEGPTRD